VRDVVAAQDDHRHVDHREDDEQEQHRRVASELRSPEAMSAIAIAVVTTIATYGVRRRP